MDFPKQRTTEHAPGGREIRNNPPTLKAEKLNGAEPMQLPEGRFCKEAKS